MDPSSDFWYKSHDSIPDFELIPSTLLPGKATLGCSYTGFVVDPSKFLTWIKSQLDKLNVKFIRKTLNDLEEAKALTGARVVINASGLGARELAQDEDVQPIRGQTVLVSVPDSQLDLLKNATMYQGSQYTYIIPRPASQSVVLGGIKQPGSTVAAPDFEFRKDILQRVNALSDGAFKWLEDTIGDPDSPLIKDNVGFRPGRSLGLRVEKDGEHVVHAYGVAGLGYLYSFGIADKVRNLLLRN
jgi:D-amino-acid oxidase